MSNCSPRHARVPTNRLTDMKALILALALAVSTAASAQPDTLSIMGVGDVMLGTNYPSERYLPPGGQNMMANAAALLQSADVAFVNLEGTILDEGGKAKQCNDPSKCYVFRMPEAYGQYLQDCGVDCASLANNHSGDMGSSGRIKTQTVLGGLNIHYAGHTNCPTAVWTQDSITYGLAAFSPNNGTLRITDIAGAQAIVAELDSLCDVVIVSFHGGAEGPDHLHVTRQTEKYYGENRGNVHKFSHAVVDAGADIVFGHGPHIVRAMELYNGRLIAYSLGNFCTYARFNLTGKRGNAPVLEVRVNAQGAFLEGQVHSFLQQGEGGPFEDPQARAYAEMQRLTEVDFPEGSGITFEAGGLFRASE